MFVILSRHSVSNMSSRLCWVGGRRCRELHWLLAAHAPHACALMHEMALYSHAIKSWLGLTWNFL
jgi:hypothetical protein